MQCAGNMQGAGKERAVMVMASGLALAQSKILAEQSGSRPIDGTIRAAHNPRRNGEDGDSGAGVMTRTRSQTKKPSMYRVLLMNDDYTPMEFVVSVLLKYFNKDQESAWTIMMHVHQHGVGECGVFTYEVAETKVTQVMDYARKHQHPLQCIMEKK